jgi:DnaJ family protein C protein 19
MSTAAVAAAVVQGGFQPEMNRREAALILGLRESAAEERIKEAHRRIMIANHPDSGEHV